MVAHLFILSTKQCEHAKDGIVHLRFFRNSKSKFTENIEKNVSLLLVAAMDHVQITV